MENKVLEKEILSTLKVDKVSLAEILKPAKRGRKAISEMDDNDLYKLYVSKCESENRPAMSKDMWTRMNELYSFDELMSTDEYEANDMRYRIESKAEKLGYVGDVLDFEAYENLSKVFYKALSKRLIMILDLESVPSLLKTANYLECSKLDCKDINLALNAKLKHIKSLLNEETQAWLKSGVSDMSLYSSENLLSDYIETYQKVLRQITDIRGESLEYVKDIFHNEFDLFEEEILANDTPDFETFYEESDSDDLEDILENDLD